MSFLENFKNISMILGGLSLLMYAMSTIGSFIKPFINVNKLKIFLEKYTKNKYISSLLGFACTVVMQSAGATTMIVLDFTNTGVLNVPSAMAFVIGSSVGTTIKSFISVLPISSIVIFISFFSTVALLITKNKNIKDVLKLIFIISLFFIGPSVTKSFFKGYIKSFEGLFKFLNNYPFLGLFIGFIFGAIFCSSSALTAVLQTVYCQSSILNFYAVLPLVFGVNVGAVIPTLVASLNSDISAKKVILVKLITRLLTIIPGIIIMFIFKNKFVNIVGTSKTVAGETQIALAHFAFNLLGAIIFVPLLPYLINVLDAILDIQKEDNSQKVDNKKLTFQKKEINVEKK